jgi:hypothetical protein
MLAFMLAPQFFEALPGNFGEALEKIKAGRNGN